MGAVAFALLLQLSMVTDGDGAPAGMSAEQEAAWGRAHLKPIIVKAKHQRKKKKRLDARASASATVELKERASESSR